MKKVLIHKKNGKYREIYIPDAATMIALKELNANLQKKYSFNANTHGFVQGRNAITNAECHIGYKYTLSFDLQDFFSSVTIDKCNDSYLLEIKDKIFIDGAAKQGLPTSPIVANIIFAPVDELILKMITTKNIDAIYTRYADDLTFSFNNIENKEEIEEIVNSAIPLMGFTINTSKTKFQTATNGKRIITGLAVNDTFVSATRKTKRRLRAALHNVDKSDQQNCCEEYKKHLYRRYKGLLEWFLCKKPKSKPLANAKADSFDAFFIEVEEAELQIEIKELSL